MWLYINKVLVVEFIADGSGGDNCYKIDLSPAATEGNIYVSNIHDEDICQFIWVVNSCLTHCIGPYS